MNWIKFYFLARKRLNSNNEYIKFQKYQAGEVIKDIDKILKIPKKSFVIDWGCGNGGYTKVLAKKYKQVLGIDFFVKPKKERNLKFEKHNLLNYISKKPADLIFCASVIEHVTDGEKLIKNINLSIKKDGFLYISFPPFYSLAGGHQLKPFHYLPKKIAIWIVKKLKRIDQRVNSYENLFVTYGLYKISIIDIKKLLENNNFNIIKYKTRYFNLLNTTKIPLLNNFLTWHAEFYCIKK